MKGIHSHNYPWLDISGRFPNKEPVRPDENDTATWQRVMHKLAGTTHLKLLAWPTSDPDWRAERDLVLEKQSYYGQTITVRVVHNNFLSRPTAYAAEMVRVAAVLRRTTTKPLWFELGNEPDLIGEGWHGDLDEYCSWKDKVVRALQLYNFQHGLFSAAVSEWKRRFQEELPERLAGTHGLAIHAYNEVHDVEQQLLWLDNMGLGHYPVMLSEFGSTMHSRMADFKRLEGLDLVAWHIFIAEGLSNGAWDQRYELSEAECSEL